jgi:O-antigen/teichoic acid export membrane protein
MGKLKSLAGETAIYGLSSIIGKAVNFLLVPFYTTTQILSVEEYGVVSELYAYVAVLNVLYLYGMETTFFRFASKNPDQETTTFHSAASSVLFSTLILSLLLVSSASAIVNFLEFPGQEIYIYLLAAIMAIDAVVALPFARLRYRGKAVRFASLKLANIFLNIGFNVFFLYFCKNVYEGDFLPGLKPLVAHIYDPDLSIEYVFISNLLANLLYVVAFLRFFLHMRIKIDWAYIRPMLLYAYPLLFSQLAGVTNEMFSRMMLKKLLPDNFYAGLNSQEALSIFAACYKLSIFMNLAIQAFRFAAEPFFFSQSQRSDAKDTYASVMYYYVLIGSVAYVAISLNLDILKHFLLQDPTYWRALHVVPVLLVANFLLGMYYNVSIWFKVTDKTHFGTLIAVSAAVLTIVLNLLLIPAFGYEGSAAVTLVVYIFMTVFGVWLGNRHYPVHYPWKKIGMYIAVSLVVMVAGWHIDLSNPTATQIVREVLVAGYAAWVVVLLRRKIRLNKN